MKKNFTLLILLLTTTWLRSLGQTTVPILNSYPDADKVIFLDFDGHTVEGTVWNWAHASIVCAPSGLDAPKITEVFNRVAEDYRPFNLNITTDEARYDAAPIGNRVRVIITVTSSWYGNTAGGVAFTGSFTWGDNTPCFVFSALLKSNIKNISEAASHEAGHTLGLFHQAEYDNNCNKLSDYHKGTGTGEIGWAPIMGVGYSKNFTLWNYGPSSLGCNKYQNDLEVITSAENGFGYRTDDHGSAFETATVPEITNNAFTATGVIEENSDNDFFRFVMLGNGRFQLDAVPYNVGTGNAGSNLDLQVSLYNESQEVLSIYNPGTLLNSVADTNLNPGVYYLKVEGKGNIYAPEYASLGSYSLQAGIDLNTAVLPVQQLHLTGKEDNGNHHLQWSVVADEKIEQQVIEVSADGKEFQALTITDINARSYVYRPLAGSSNRYRIQVTLASGHRYYSNNLSIKPGAGNLSRPQLTSNLITSNTVYVNSPASYNYLLTDMNGKMIKKGVINNGVNAINHQQSLPAGMYFISFYNHIERWTDKLVLR